MHTDMDVLHITSNLFLLILFGVFLEKQIGFKHLIVIYIFSGILTYIAFDLRKEYEKLEFKEVCLKNDIDLAKVTFNKSGVYQNNKYVQGLDNEQLSILKKYSSINEIFLGSSGSVIGILSFFILFNLFNLKHILLKLLGSLFMALIVLNTMNTYVSVSGTDFGHAGGMIGGCLYVLIYGFIQTRKKVV